MISVEESIKYLSQYITETYFDKKDYHQLSFFLNENMTWSGLEKNGKCLNKDDVLDVLTKEIGVHIDEYDIHGQCFECRQITDEVCIVTAIIKFQNHERHTLKVLNLSIVWKYMSKENNWKVTHIHHSIVDDDIQQSRLLKWKTNPAQYFMRKQDYINIDPLTKINNLRGFEKEVVRLLHKNSSQRYALIKFGLKNLRFINYRFGYELGDELLKEISLNLKNSLTDQETCGRIEKGRFAMLYKFENVEEFEKRLYWVRDQLIEKGLINRLEGLDIQLSAGIYLIEDKHEYIKDMLDKALIALQGVSKSLRGSHFTYFDESMLKEQYRTSGILEEAPKAIENDEFLLFIQPQFDIKTQQIVSGEALTRWKLKDGTIRMPDEFIEKFEENGMITIFDFYMLEKLCKQIKEWMDEGYKIVPISINQSRLHMQNQGYLDEFVKIIDQYNIPREYIIFELTETAFINDNEKVKTLAKRLHELGFRLAIDDFGTGYTSLNMLSYVVADILKIDRTLLHEYNINKRVRIVIGKIIEMAHQMNMEVVAEGIETEAQLIFLQNLGCDIGQGYYIGKPVVSTCFPMGKYIEKIG